MNRHFFVTVTIIGLSLFLSACATSKASFDYDQTTPNVEVAVATQQEVRENFSYVGTIKADEKTYVTAQVSGIIKNIFVSNGDSVQKNSLVVELENNPESTLAAAQYKSSQELLDASKDTLKNLLLAKESALKSAEIAIKQTSVGITLADQTTRDLERLKDEQMQSLDSTIASSRTALSLAESNHNNAALTGVEMIAGSENQKDQLLTALDALDTRIEDTKKVQKEVEDIAKTSIDNAEDALDFAEDMLRDLKKAGASASDISQAELAVLQAESQLELAKKNEDQIISQNRAELAALQKNRESILEQLNGSDISVSQTNLTVQTQNDSLQYNIELARENVTNAEKQRNVVAAQLDQQINTARNQLMLARTQYESAQANLESSTREYDTKIAEAKTSIAAIRSTLNVAKVQADNLIIHSPITGQVTKELTSVGDLVAPGTPLLEITNLNSLEVIFSVPENETGFSQIGTALTLGIPGSDTSINGEVINTINQSSTFTRKTELKGKLEDSSMLNDGQFVKVHLQSPPVKKLLVPLEAVHTRYKTDYVFVVENGIAHQRNVTTGNVVDNNIEIIDGLSEGATVVVRHDIALSNNTSVNIEQ